jgi:hypothetical protein
MFGDAHPAGFYAIIKTIIYKGLKMSLSDIQNMPTAQKIHLMELLWESLCVQEEPKSPSWHKEILDIRAKKLKESHVKTYTLDELKALR